jgi:SET domain-containing protein 6
MKSLIPIPRGSEIFNDYGPLPRSDLLRRYGYVTDNYAKYDVVEVSTQSITAAAEEDLELNKEAIAERVSYLEEIDALDDDAFDITHASKEDSNDLDMFPESLKLLILLLVTSSDSFNSLKSNPKGAKALSKLIEKNEFPTEWFEFLELVVKRRLEQYKSNVSEDRKLLTELKESGSRDKMNERKLMALHVRIGEMELLEDALLRLNREKDQKEQVSTGGKRKADGEGDGDVEMGNTSSTKRRK